MEAIVLAGGFGTRLRSIVSNVPKPMAPVAGRPFLELLLTALKFKGVTHVILSLGYKSEAVTAYFSNVHLGMRLNYEIESTPLGTGGAIAAALRQATQEHVFVFNGDTYIDLDLRAVAAMWPDDRTPIVVARPVEDTARYGALDISGERILHFAGAGRPGAGVINAGCYLIPSDLFADRRIPAAFSFEQDFLAHRPPLSLRVFITEGQFIDIGVPDDYRRAQVELAALARSQSLL